VERAGAGIEDVYNDTMRFRPHFLLPALLAAPLAAQSAGVDTVRPELAGSPFATREDELNAAFTPHGDTVYFTRKSGDRSGVIMVATREQGRWSAPQVAPFSGQFADYDPFVTPDGRRLLWMSNRPVDGTPKSDFDIWMVERRGTGWGAPVRLEAPVNSEASEYYPTVSADGTLYFSSNREGGMGRGDLYRSRSVGGRYAEVESLGDPVNSPAFEGDPFISPDGQFLIFTAWGRPGGDPDGDLYIAYRRGSGWNAAIPLPPGINTPAQEYAPIVSPDGKWLYFASYRPIEGGAAKSQGSVYRVPIERVVTPP
jgi:Tol biopolymer transport system component